MNKDVIPTAISSHCRIRAAMAELLEAFEFAQQGSCDPSIFAVEFRILCEIGMSHNHLRWLVFHDYLRHGIDDTPQNNRRRSVRRVKWLIFRDASCFVLTPAGADLARTICANKELNGSPVPTVPSSNEQSSMRAMSCLPHWDAGLRQLSLGGIVLRRFRGRVGNQELLVAAFEEEHWASRIDDPLPQDRKRNPKKRLRGAVEKLNESLIVKLLIISCDGTGEGVCWALNSEAT